MNNILVDCSMQHIVQLPFKNFSFNAERINPSSIIKLLGHYYDFKSFFYCL